MAVAEEGLRRRRHSDVKVCVGATGESRAWALRPGHVRRPRLRAETAVEGRPWTLTTLRQGGVAKTIALQEHSEQDGANDDRREESCPGPLFRRWRAGRPSGESERISTRAGRACVRQQRFREMTTGEARGLWSWMQDQRQSLPLARTPRQLGGKVGQVGTKVRQERQRAR